MLYIWKGYFFFFEHNPHYFFVYDYGKSDFYLYLVENQFIVAEYVKCKKCEGKMNFRLNKSKPEGCVWACNNKIGVGIKATKCNSSRSARVNSWFYKSKLSMQEILLLSYLW